MFLRRISRKISFRLAAGFCLLFFFSSAIVFLFTYRSLNTAIRTIQNGDFEARVPAKSTGDEIDVLITLFNQMIERIQVVATVPLQGKPEVAVFDASGHVFVNIEDKNEIAVIDTKTNKVQKRWSLAPCDSPSGLAVDSKFHRLFAVCNNGKMAIVNSETGKVVTTVPIGKKPDSAAFDPASSLAFSSNGEGNLTVVHESSPEKFEVVENATTQLGARTMALSLKTHQIYLVTAKYEALPKSGSVKPGRPKITPGTVELLVLKN